MSVEKIGDPQSFMNSFSLHDVRIEKINLDFDSQSVEIIVEDLNWNYEGLPNYVERPCSITFEGVVAFFLDVLNIEGLRIHRNQAQVVDGLIRVDFDLNIGGGDSSWGKDRSSISLTFESMKIVDR
jgi:hypothetical protein